MGNQCSCTEVSTQEITQEQLDDQMLKVQYLTNNAVPLSPKFDNQSMVRTIRNEQKTPRSSRYFQESEKKTNRASLQKDNKKPFVFENGAIYEGEWLCDGVREGYGVQVWPDGARYEGMWKNNMAEGKGKFYHVDGDICKHYNIKMKEIGQMTKQMDSESINIQVGHITKECGLKTCNKWTDGSRFEGDYYQGFKHGAGSYTWPDASSYQGDWQRNVINGNGTYRWADGRVYTGEWVDNMMHGYGFYQWPDGRSYQGEYINDKKHGYGVYTWKDGKVYKGMWLDGKQDGQGEILVDGNTIYGIWRNGKKV